MRAYWQPSATQSERPSPLPMRLLSRCGAAPEHTATPAIRFAAMRLCSTTPSPPSQTRTPLSLPQIIVLCSTCGWPACSTATPARVLPRMRLPSIRPLPASLTSTPLSSPSRIKFALMSGAPPRSTATPARLFANTIESVSRPDESSQKRTPTPRLEWIRLCRSVALVRGPLTTTEWPAEEEMSQSSMQTCSPPDASTVARMGDSAVAELCARNEGKEREGRLSGGRGAEGAGCARSAALSPLARLRWLC